MMHGTTNIKIKFRMPKIKTFVPDTLCFLHAEGKAPQSKVI